jgi:putative transposase
MPRLRHYDQLNTVRFITFSCYRRHKLLISPAVIIEFLESLKSVSKRYAIKLYAYVIMPEHVHLVLHPPDSLKLGPVIGELKAHSAGRIISRKLLALPDSCQIYKDGRVRQIFWLPRCYDHNCRTRGTVTEKIRYCHRNPVSRGLVMKPSDWRWSSYNWYAGERDVPLVMDEIDSDFN